MTGDGQSYNWGKVSMGYKSVIRGNHLSLPPHKLMEGLLWMKDTSKGITTVWTTVVVPYVAWGARMRQYEGCWSLCGWRGHDLSAFPTLKNQKSDRNSSNPWNGWVSAVEKGTQGILILPNKLYYMESLTIKPPQQWLASHMGWLLGQLWTAGPDLAGDLS